MDHILVGKTGENIACTFLKQKGFRIICRNYKKQWGEIDIIAEKDDSIRFIEVKTVSRENRENVDQRAPFWSKIPRHLFGSIKSTEIKDKRNGSRETGKKGGKTKCADYRPEEQVHSAKLRRLMRTASFYMDNVENSKDYQIDVVGIFLDRSTRTARCRLLENVF